MYGVSTNEYRQERAPSYGILAHFPGEHFAMDLAGPFPKAGDKKVHLMILVDVCTRFVLLDALENKNAPTVAKALVRRFSKVGFPKVLQSDNGKVYNNRFLKEVAKEMSIQHRFTTPYHLAEMASLKIA